MDEHSPTARLVETPEILPTEIAYADADVSTRYDDVYETVSPDEVASVRWRNHAYEFVCKNRVTLRVSILESGIVRLRYSPNGFQDGEPRDFSYAVDPAFKPEKVTVTLHETDNDYLLVSGPLQTVVSKVGLKVRFFDQDDRVLCEDAEGYSARRTILRGWNEVKISKKCARKEVFYGLGDKTCGANLHGRKFENWCTDAYGYDRETDPLYRAIPFYYALSQGAAYGIFLDNTYRTHFDFNSAGTETTEFRAEGGEINYYFLYGPGLTDVTRAYARLTGRHALPPMWALGYHQCRWSYYPESRVQEIADQFRELQIPCDAIYLDIDYMDGYRCFTWDREHFPEPKRLVEELKGKGFETVVMIDPGIKEDSGYAVYREGLEKGFFVRTADGEIAKGPVWPGWCAFPDFTRPEVRAWWGDLYEDLYKNLGISGFWNDMNEPAVFHVNHKTLPETVRHDYDGDPCSHRKAHNVYGQQMARASWEGFRRLQPDKRPYLLTRATFSGGQRFSAVWTGDNHSDWEHLQIANIQCQRLAISGMSFCGTDIGGFAGIVEPELFVRWLQLAVFHPLMRVHSMGQHAGGDVAIATEEAQLREPEFHTSEQEPWSFGEKWTELARKAIELRYCLLPCLYTALWRHAQDGTPVLRHLSFADQQDPKLWDQERDFLFGEHLLVSPVIQPKTQRQAVYLPAGDWYYFWTGQQAAGEWFASVMPEQIPFFIRAGAVLPVYPVRQYVNEKPVDELTLYVYYKKEGTEISRLYEDAGEGYAQDDGEFSLKIFETEGTEGQFTLRQRREGKWQPPYLLVKIYFVGFPTYVRHCAVDGDEMPIKEIRLRDRSLYTLTIGPDFKMIEWKGE